MFPFFVDVNSASSISTLLQNLLYLNDDWQHCWTAIFDRWQNKRYWEQIFPNVEKCIILYLLLKLINIVVHSPLFQIAWILILSAFSILRVYSSANDTTRTPFAISYCTRRILLNVYVALIDVVSLVVNVLITKAKCKYVNLLIAAKLKQFYLLTTNHNNNTLQLVNKNKQYVYLSILSLEIID